MSAQTYYTFFADHRPALNVALRSLMAILGGYGLAALAAATLAVGLPLPRVESVMAAIMLSFIVHALAVVWVFAAATLLRAAVGLVLPACAFGFWLQLVQAGGAA